MDYRLKCHADVPNQRYFFNGEWGAALWFYGVSDTVDPFYGNKMRTDSPFLHGPVKADFEQWAKDHLEGEWFVADTFRVAFKEPGDLAFAYLAFL